MRPPVTRLLEHFSPADLGAVTPQALYALLQNQVNDAALQRPTATGEAVYQHALALALTLRLNHLMVAKSSVSVVGELAFTRDVRLQASVVRRQIRDALQLAGLPSSAYQQQSFTVPVVARL